MSNKHTDAEILTILEGTMKTALKIKGTDGVLLTAYFTFNKKLKYTMLKIFMGRTTDEVDVYSLAEALSGIASSPISPLLPRLSRAVGLVVAEEVSYAIKEVDAEDHKNITEEEMEKVRKSMLDDKAGLGISVRYLPIFGGKEEFMITGIEDTPDGIEVGESFCSIEEVDPDEPGPPPTTD